MSYKWIITLLSTYNLGGFLLRVSESLWYTILLKSSLISRFYQLNLC